MPIPRMRSLLPTTAMGVSTGASATGTATVNGHVSSSSTDIKLSHARMLFQMIFCVPYLLKPFYSWLIVFVAFDCSVCNTFIQYILIYMVNMYCMCCIAAYRCASCRGEESVPAKFNTRPFATTTLCLKPKIMWPVSSSRS